MSESDGSGYIEQTELVFLGTGTSGGVPDLGCLVDAERKCKTCWNALEPGSRNRRHNTSIVIKTTFTPIVVSEATPVVRTRNILIDCGKYFWASALKTFPNAGIDHLDAVVLSHGHADAFFGVDDLRDFSNIRDGGATLKVFVREQDVPELQRAFPYLMNKGQTANGMHVPALDFVVYDETAPLDIFGLTLTPLPVHHGPGVTCSAFAFGNSLYMSDVNDIPENTRQWIQQHLRPSSTTDGALTLQEDALDVFVLDALWPTESYNSHFSLEDAIKEFKTFRPKRGFTTGMSHLIEYNTYSEYLKEVSKENHLDLALAWDGLTIEIKVPSSAGKWPLPVSEAPKTA